MVIGDVRLFRREKGSTSPTSSNCTNMFTHEFHRPPQSEAQLTSNRKMLWHLFIPSQILNFPSKWRGYGLVTISWGFIWNKRKEIQKILKRTTNMKISTNDIGKEKPSVCSFIFNFGGFVSCVLQEGASTTSAVSVTRQPPTLSP